MDPDHRRHIAGDMMKARQYLNALESAGSGTLVAEALTLAAIVSYCRPFLSSFVAANARTAWLPKQWIDKLPSEFRRTHDRLVTARHQAWAHTDYSAHIAHSNARSAFVISHNPWAPLSPSQIAEFHELIDEIDRRLEIEREAS